MNPSFESPAPGDSATTRREFLKNTGRLAAATALAGVTLPHVHAAENNLIQVALVGCGGRGSGAAVDALSAKNGPIKLVAMADVFDDRLKSSYAALKHAKGEMLDVPEERKFVGFDGYKHAMDCLKPGDVVIFATPPAFRWVHFTYAIEKGLHVFMEKPVTVDAPTTKKMLALAAQSRQKNLKVGVGLMCRHSQARQELAARIQDGEIGELVLMQAYRMHPPVAACFATARANDGMSELLYQIRNFHSFLWASGGLFSDFYIHNIDECCWMKGAWPVRAEALGGRQYRGNCVDQNFDVYAVEYTFADGAKALFDGRTMQGCREDHLTRVFGTEGCAAVSASGHAQNSASFKGLDFARDRKIWAHGPHETNPYEQEWIDLIDAIRNDKPYNEVQRGAEVSLVTSMGRMAAHTGQVITWDAMVNAPQEFAPGVGELAMTSPAPLLSIGNGAYPIPQPGIITDREY